MCSWTWNPDQDLVCCISLQAPSGLCSWQQDQERAQLPCCYYSLIADTDLLFFFRLLFTNKACTIYRGILYVRKYGILTGERTRAKKWTMVGVTALGIRCLIIKQSSGNYVFFLPSSTCQPEALHQDAQKQHLSRYSPFHMQQSHWTMLNGLYGLMFLHQDTHLRLTSDMWFIHELLLCVHSKLCHM